MKARGVSRDMTGPLVAGCWCGPGHQVIEEIRMRVMVYLTSAAVVGFPCLTNRRNRGSRADFPNVRPSVTGVLASVGPRSR
jgi:hypothetical protein